MAEIHSSTFNKWTRCYGKAYEHSGKVPRNHWLTDQEKQAIIQYHFDHPLNGYRRLTTMMMDAMAGKQKAIHEERDRKREEAREARSKG